MADGSNPITDGGVGITEGGVGIMGGVGITDGHDGGGVGIMAIGLRTTKVTAGTTELGQYLITGCSIGSAVAKGIGKRCVQ